MTLVATMRAESQKRVCEGCSKQIKGKVRKQRCENCYRARLRHDRDTGKRGPATKRTSNSPGEAALAAVEHAPNGCWLYTGPLDRDGYGKTIELKGYPKTAPHRAVYQHLVGPIPEGMHLDHLCHHPDTCAGGITCLHRRCVNPAHLKPTTPKANNERSNSITAINARKSHCKNGHEFTPENTRIQMRRDGRTWRKCCECHRELLRRKSST